MNISALLSTTVAELALSADNVMVWALIMQRLDVPARLQRRVLAAGIGIAFVMRVGAVAIGSAALEHMAWLHYVLGIVLLGTAYRVWRSESHATESDGGLARWASKLGSPALAATVALGLTDLLFAIDSIPASFGITHDPAVIITANVVALAGLWIMYGYVSRLMERLTYLTKGLVIVLAWVGLVTLSPIDVPELVNLGVIISVLGAAVVVSLIGERNLTMDREREYVHH